MREDLVGLASRLVALTGALALLSQLVSAGRKPVSEPGRVAASSADLSVSIPVAAVRPSDLEDSFSAPRPGNRRHRAMDIAAPRGTAVVASADGRITRLARSARGGLAVYQIDSRNEVCFFYAHLQRFARGLRVGAPIRRGEVLGFVGSTGNAPENAPHLHFEVRRLDAGGDCARAPSIDPYPLLTGQSRSR